MKIHVLTSLSIGDFEKFIDSFPSGQPNGLLLSPKDNEDIVEEFKSWCKDTLTDDVYIMDINENQLYIASKNSEDMLHIQLRWSN